MAKVNKSLTVENCYNNYETTLVPQLVRSLLRKESKSTRNCSKVNLVGSFPSKQNTLKSSSISFFEKYLSSCCQIKIFHTAECQRYNSQNSDFSISSDLGVQSNNHFRLPHWMEFIDWSHQIDIEVENPRFGELLNLERLMKPLGDGFLNRKRKLAFFTSHMREPRGTFFEIFNKEVGIDGYGPFFNKKILDHNSSGLLKKDILSDYSFNLCPENNLYPGYVTEKIPEAFQAGCLPVTWVDPNVKCDFNPKAFINLHDFAEDYSAVSYVLQSENELLKYTSEPLLTKKPSILPLVEFLKGALES